MSVPQSKYGSHLTVPSKVTQVRRSSSLQLTLFHDDKKNPLGTQTVIVDASEYDITTGFNSPTASTLNLYTLMARYRCCFGRCRLRVASAIISVISILLAIIVLCLFLVASGSIDPKLQDVITIPLLSSSIFQVLASICMLAGIFMDRHFLILPFLLSCVTNMMGWMGIGLVLLVSTDQVSTSLYPLWTAITMGLVALHLWFLVITSMTFVLIRDKRRFRIDRDLSRSFEEQFERVNSSFF